MADETARRYGARLLDGPQVAVVDLSDNGVTSIRDQLVDSTADAVGPKLGDEPEFFITRNGWVYRVSIEAIVCQEDVDSSLDAAAGNGYDYAEVPVDDVATDMCDNDSTFENVNHEALVPLVVNWQQRQGEK